LGDDIVFFDEAVALEYLTIMETIGVPINLAKSVVAKNATFEFAKVTGHRGNHVAAISWAMFMSQPTAMGRVGIAYSLLQKGIAHTRPVSYLTTLSRESKYNAGLPNLFFTALAAMLAKNGTIRFAPFLHSILEFDSSSGKLNILPALTSQSKVGGIVRSIAAWVRGEPLAPLVGLKSSNEVATSDLAVKMSLVKTIKAFVYGRPMGDIRVDSLNPHEDAARLARTLTLQTLAFTNEAREELGKALDSEGAFTWNPKVFSRLSPVGRLVHPVFCLLYANSYEFFLGKWLKLTAVKPLQLKSLSMEELLALMDHIARYREKQELPARTNDKVAKVVIPSKNLIESPLRVLVDILKSESKLEDMRAIMLSAGVDVSKIVSYLSATAIGGVEDNPGYTTPRNPPTLGLIREMMSVHGEEYILKFLSK